MSFGEYEVIGGRRYRGHEPGTVFEAQLDRLTEQRAIRRGDLRLLRKVTPDLPAGATFPDGWLPPRTDVSSSTNHEAPEGASVIEGG